MSNENQVAGRLRQLGWRRTGFYYLMHALERVFGLHLHYVFVNSGLPDRAGITTPPGYEHQTVEPQALMPFVDSCPALSAEFLAEAQARGDDCIASFHEGKLVGFDFNSFSRAPVTDQLDIVVPTGFRYGYKGWTDPEHRRQKLSQARIEIKKSTDTMAMFYIKVNNYPSLLRPYRYPTNRRLLMGYVGWVNWLGKERPFASRKARWIGCEFVRKGSTHHRLYAET